MAAPPVASTSTSQESTQTARQTKENEELLDVSVLKELARKALVDALNSVRIAAQKDLLAHSNAELQVNGVKTLVLDNSLAGPLGLITEVSLLKVCTIHTLVNSSSLE